MRSLKKIIVSLLMGAGAFLTFAANAQTPNAQKTVAATKSPTKPVAKSAAKQEASKPVQEVPLEPQALSIAERVHVGNLPCELGASVRMTADAQNPGYFNLQGKGYKYRMRPVSTTTGAIRLEDEKAGAVWLQLANKSMLMDQKNGRRLADECAHPDQVAVANDMKINPPPALIDVNTTTSSVQR